MKQITHEDIIELGWELVESPRWLNSFENRYIPKVCYHIRYDEDDFEGHVADDIKYYYFLVYDHSTICIYVNQIGGFGGGNVKFPIFIGRTVLQDKVTELKLIMEFLNIQNSRK